MRPGAPVPQTAYPDAANAETLHHPADGSSGEDDLQAMRGFAMGMLSGAILWIVAGVLVWRSVR